MREQGSAEFALAPYINKSPLEDVEEFVLFIDKVDILSPGESLRQQFEQNYAHHLVHQRHILQPRPSKADNPEGFTQWMESDNHLRVLAQEDLRTASIVNRLTTPVHDRINRNTQKQTRINKWGYEVDEYGKEIWLSQDNEEDEWEELTREAKRSEGTEVPINHLETLAIIDALDDYVIREKCQIGLLDTIYDGREGGKAFRIDGTELYHEPDLDMQREYDRQVAKIENRIQELRDAQQRYINLLSPSEQLEWRKKNKLSQ